MLDNINNTQSLADILKGFVLSSQTIDKAARIGVLRAIQELEKAGWHGPAMADALSRAGISLDDRGLEFKRKGKEALADIEDAISIYFQNISHKRDPLSEIFDMEEAAEYLGISKDMMYTYVTRQQRLRGKKIGTNYIFSRQGLDEFKKTMRKAGNPNLVRKKD